MPRLRTSAPLALLSLLIGFAIAAPASARIIRATSVLPPGESGFVAVTGLLTGSGSPHLYDQQNPFITFRRANDVFNMGGTTEVPGTGVTIVRDHFGVPDVSAATSAKL